MKGGRLKVVKILRSDKAAIFWTLIRLYLAWNWLKAGWNKITGKFDISGFLDDAIKNTIGDHPSVLSWYATFLDRFVLPNIDLFNLIVPWGEVFVGLGLILGMFTTVSLLAGVFMNLNFILAGAVSPNLTFFTLSVILLLMGPASYRFGFDYYFWPKIKELFFQN